MNAIGGPLVTDDVGQSASRNWSGRVNKIVVVNVTVRNKG